MIKLFKKQPIKYEVTFNENNDIINFTLDNNRVYISQKNFDICLSNDLLTNMLYKISKKFKIVII